MLTLFLATVLALSAPPSNVLAVVVFLVAAVLAGIQKAWPICLIAVGLALLSWPW